jgi:hypothetical protein
VSSPYWRFAKTGAGGRPCGAGIASASLIAGTGSPRPTETVSCSTHWTVVNIWPARLDRRVERRACIPGRCVSSVQHGNASMPLPPATSDLASAIAREGDPETGRDFGVRRGRLLAAKIASWLAFRHFAAT